MAHRDSLKLKRLQSERYTLQQEIGRLQATQVNIQRSLENLQRKMIGVQRQIAQIEDAPQDIIISEHAILRYFERVLGYDMDVITAAILPEADRQVILGMGSGTYPIQSCNYHYRVCVNGTVITTIFTTQEEK